MAEKKDKSRIIIPRKIKSIDDLIQNPDYRRIFSEQLNTLFGAARSVTSSKIDNISHRESMNSFTAVYRENLEDKREEKEQTWDPYRVWKVRSKESYKDNSHRHSYEYDATILTWLKKRLAPVPTLITYVQDLATKEQYEDEANEDMRNDLESLGIKVNLPKESPKEAMILVKLKEPRHDQDLVYLLTQIPEEEREKKIRREMGFALESVFSVNTIANHYLSEFIENSETDIDGVALKPHDPFKEDPEYHLTRIVESFERLAKLNIIQSCDSRYNKLMSEVNGAENSKEELNGQLKEILNEKNNIPEKQCLDDKIKEMIKQSFGLVVEHTSKNVGFSQREAHPYHIARSEVPNWKGYHLFDFDKAGIDSIFLDPVMYLTNFITKLPYEKVQDLFLRGLVHGAKKIIEMEEGDKEFISETDLPIKWYKKYKKDIMQFEIVSDTPTSEAVKWLDRGKLKELLKLKDFTALYTFMEMIGRSSKSEYGDEFDRYDSTINDNKEVEYHSSWLCPDGNCKLDISEWYVGDPIRDYCVKSIYGVLDRMIENDPEKLMYKLEDDEVNKLRDLRLFLRGFNFEYEGNAKKINPFNISNKE